MFDSTSYEEVMSRMLRDLPDKYDKREGSVLYTALAPAGAEFTKMYNSLAHFINETFADTASYEYLIRRAKERGLEPYKATKSVLRAEFNVHVDNGSRFGVDNLTFKVLDHIEDDYYMVECEQSGVEGNSYVGSIVPLQYIDGLTKAQIVEVLIPARDMEDVEDFRRRYFDSFQSEAFGGNVQDYKGKVTSLDGVGSVRVVPAWNGGGTVKVIITNNELKVPSSVLINSVQNELYPSESEVGLGYGIAPIGHDVTVVGVKSRVIDIKARIILDTGQIWSNVLPNILEELEVYFDSLRKDWSSVDDIIVRIAQIESSILRVPGVIDISNTKINNLDSNISLDVDEIPELGVVDNEI